jgi:DNA-binding MarR family transcriptional regulator
MKKNESDPNLSHEIAHLDRLVHEPARLHILAVLAVVESADFIFLMRQTEMTSGNLSTHLTKLENAGYVEITKEFVEKMPRTLVKLTTQGREAFETYRKTVLHVLGDRS